MGGHLPPPLRSAFYWRVFCTPILHRREAHHFDFLKRGKPFLLPSGTAYLLKGWSFGTTGPRVVLSHGWQGSAASWHVLAPKLVNAGFRVIVYHAPGHHSRPRRSSLPDFMQGLRDIVETFGAEYLVGHSFGAMTVAGVSQEIPDLRGMALYSSPDELLSLALGFCQTMTMSELVQSEFLERLRKHSTRPLEEETVSHYLRSLQCPLLLIHDKDDEVISVENSVRLAQRPRTELIVTEELGHRLIIREESLADKVVEFFRRDRNSD